MLHEPGSFMDFDPRYQWLHGEDSDTLLLDASGFRKEQLRVLISTSGNLKISGERPTDGNLWVRFLKEFLVSKNCYPRGIQAKFDKETGLLYVILPKLGTQNGSQAVAKPDASSSHGRYGYPSSERGAASDGGEAAKERDLNGGEKGDGHAEGSKLGSEMKDGNAMYKSRIGVVGGISSGLSRHKIFLMSVAVVVTVVIGLGAYTVYKLWFVQEKHKN